MNSKINVRHCMDELYVNGKPFEFTVPLAEETFTALYRVLSPATYKKYHVLDLTLANLVLTLANSAPIDLVKLRATLEAQAFIHRVPRLFSGLSVKFTVGATTVTGIFFKTGKIVLVGIKAMPFDGVRILIKTIAYLLTISAATDTVCFNITISNKVYSFSIDPQFFPTSLIDFYNAVGMKYIEYIEYNPSAFPGLTLRVPGSSAVILLFNSRKCILTGGTRHDEGLAQHFYQAVGFFNKLVSESRVRGI